jgi:hypothetical protein
MRGRIDAAGETVQHALHPLGEGAGPDDAILSAAQLRCRDHLHGLGDLLRRFHRANAPPEVKQ